MKKLMILAMVAAANIAASAFTVREVVFAADEIPATNPRIKRRGDTVTRIEVFGKFEEQEDGSVKTKVVETAVDMDSVTAKIWAKEAKKHLGTATSKKYSRLSIYVACVRLGLWDKLESWLKTQTVDGVNAYTAFMLATELTADNELFIPMLNAAAAALGVDDATIQAVLSASEM